MSKLTAKRNLKANARFTGNLYGLDHSSPLKHWTGPPQAMEVRTDHELPGQTPGGLVGGRLCYKDWTGPSTDWRFGKQSAIQFIHVFLSLAISR